MGFLTNTGTTVTLTAKLTPYGRQQLLTNSSSIITQFSIGDSDANYYGDLPSENIPSLAGELGTNGTFSNGVYSNVVIKNTIQVNSTGSIKKAVQTGSNSVVITPMVNGSRSLDLNTDQKFVPLFINRTLGDTDGNSNLFQSLGLPITQTQKNLYTSGTYLSSAISTVNQDKVIVLGISGCEYGEVIDGKTVKVVVERTTGSTITLYSTFQKTLTPLTTQDGKIVEDQSMGTPFGKNVALLFCDTIKRPNGNSTKSWATGYGLTKPFSLNGKEQFNSVANTSTGAVVDTCVGIVYLDKGIIVITHPDIVNDFTLPTIGTTGTTITYNSISNQVAQNITCIVERDEFAMSNNPTYTAGEPIRVSEVALYDSSNNLIAFAKSNQHIIIGSNQFMALGVRILV